MKFAFLEGHIVCLRSLDLRIQCKMICDRVQLNKMPSPYRRGVKLQYSKYISVHLAIRLSLLTLYVVSQNKLVKSALILWKIQESLYNYLHDEGYIIVTCLCHTHSFVRL